MKRLFFGLEVVAPWPDDFPKGRILKEENRHVTLAFLGEIDSEPLIKQLNDLPKLKIVIGPVAKFDQCLFLPKLNPRVAAWHIHFFEEEQSLIHYQKKLVEWLEEKGFLKGRDNSFLPHLTIARNPKEIKLWEEQFKPIPLYIKAIHLYESFENSIYHSLWNHPLNPPIEEIEHTADIAFRIQGMNYQQLYLHSQIALTFSFDQILDFIDLETKVDSLEEIIAALNKIVSKADAKIGCPFKAVSYHGKIEKEKEILKWEMIIDV